MATLKINVGKYYENLRHLEQLFHNDNRTLMAVSKGFGADEELIKEINKTNIKYIADSSIKNLKKIKTDKLKVMLRIPKISEVSELVLASDVSLNSELETIIKINEAAKQNNLIHRIILMIDLGDLREGMFYKDFDLKIVENILKLENIELLGIGTNLTCYGGVIPSIEVYNKLLNIKENIEDKLKINLEVISGGNSSAINLFMKNELSPVINNLRIGEAFILGRETAYGSKIKDMHDDVFILEAEIVELKIKPSMPEGELGFDAFGNKVSFVDKGEMKRAILAIGKQDVYPNDLIPIDDIEILGASSDHLLVDISKTNYKLGDKVLFKLTYGGVLSLSTSTYINKVYE